MISFTCDKCGKTFKVPDEYAGRTAKCKLCGNALTVPALAVPVSTVAPPSAPALIEVAPVVEEIPEPITTPTGPKKIPMRTRRLLADAQAMGTAFADFDAIKVTSLAGNPPETYRVNYSIASLKPGTDGEPVPTDKHEIEIQLTSEYPRLSPKCKILTPIFHPNFNAAAICVADHWTAGERLVDLVIRIGEMIAFQAYNIQSPLDGQAAMWVDLNRAKLPIDARNMHPTELE